MNNGQPIPEEVVSAANETVEATYVGIGIVAKNKATRIQAINNIIFPYSYTMPCGNKVEIESVLKFPKKDLPCPCGNPKHWYVKFYKSIPGNLESPFAKR